MGGVNERPWIGSIMKPRILPMFLLFMALLLIIPQTVEAQQVSFTISHDTVYVNDFVTVSNTSTGMPIGTQYKWCFSGIDIIVFQDSTKWVDDTLCELILDAQFTFKTGYPNTLPLDTLEIILFALDSTDSFLPYSPYYVRVPVIANIWPVMCLEPAPGNPCIDNFVCNGDFEDITTTNLVAQGLHLCVPWLGSGAEAFHSSSSDPNFSVPNNKFGLNRYARSGYGYGGFHPRYYFNNMFVPGANSECITGMIKFDMFAGQSYNVVFYAALSSYSNLATQLVAYIDPTASVISTGVPLQNAINSNPQWVVSNTQPAITNSYWTKVEGVFSPPSTVQPTIVIGAPDITSIVQANAGCSIGQWCLAYYYIDDVEIVPLPPSVTVDGSPTYINGCLFYEMTTSDPQNVARYEWRINGVVQPNSNVPAITLPSNGVSIELTVYNYHNCPVTYIFPVDPPCIQHHSQGAAYDIILENLKASNLISNYTGGNPTWSTSEPINILGTLSIDVDFTFYGCQNIIMGRDAKVIVQDGINFTINNCTIVSCDAECFFWDGIYAEDPDSKITIVESSVSHAKNAVYSRNNPELYIDNNEFSYNLIGIHITNHQRDASPIPPWPVPPPVPVPANVTIIYNEFNGDLQNMYPQILNALPGFDGMEWGIRVDTVDLLTIGVNNTFEGLSCGIHINTGNVVIEGNQFSNIKHHTTLVSDPTPWGHMTFNSPYREGAIVVDRRIDYSTTPPNLPYPDYYVPPSLTVTSNSFSDCHMGVYVFGHPTTVFNNLFEDITYNSFRGTQLTYLSLTYNQHSYNITEPLHPYYNYFNYEYIVAQAKQSMSGHNIEISNNEITTYKSGINLINTTSTGLSQVNPKRWVDVHDNEIYLNDIGEEPFLQGIRLQGADRSRIYQNIIENIDQNNYPTSQTPMGNLQGILVSQTTDAKVFDNYSIVKFGKGINNIGYNIGSQFWCNNFYYNFFGFHVEPPGMGTNTGMSDQLVTQEENHNCFYNNIDLWINNQFNNNPFVWYYTVPLNPHNIECTPYYYDNIWPQIGSSLDDPCAPLPDNWVDPLSREELFGAIARNEDTIYGALQEEFEWYARDHLFRSLYGDSMLMNMGVSEDSIYMHFYNYFSNSNIASFAEIEYLIDNYDIEQALWDNNNIVTQTLIEFNLQRVNEILLESWALGYDVDSTQRSILEAIALLTPYVGGNAVFTARVILGIDPFNHGLPYRKSKENPLKPVLQALIYPNPTTGTLTVEFADSGEKIDGVFEIYDIQGRKVMSSYIDNTGGMKLFNVSNLKNEIYLVKILMNNGQHLSKKLIKSQ